MTQTEGNGGSNRRPSQVKSSNQKSDTSHRVPPEERTEAEKHQKEELSSTSTGSSSSSTGEISQHTTGTRGGTNTGSGTNKPKAKKRNSQAEALVKGPEANASVEAKLPVDKG
jgi:Ulp1 family protease